MDPPAAKVGVNSVVNTYATGAIQCLIGSPMGWFWLVAAFLASLHTTSALALSFPKVVGALCCLGPVVSSWKNPLQAFAVFSL